MDAFDLGWITAMIEGEGSFGENGPVGMRLRVASTDRDTLERFAAIVGVGTVSGPIDKGPRRKDAWVWSAWGKEAIAVTELVLPHLGDRRARRAAGLLMRIYRNRERLTAPRDCVTCGETYWPVPTVKGRSSKYCSKRCRDRASELRRLERFRPA